MKKITDYAELVKAKHALNKTIAPVEDGANIAGSYTSGKQFIRGGVLYTALTTIAANTAWSSLTLDTDYELADDLTSQLASLNQTLTNNLADEVSARATLGAHNILPNNAVSKTINGVTFTVNSDGSFTVNGTAEQGFNYGYATLKDWIKPNTSYIFTTGVPYDSSSANLTIAYKQNSGDSNVYILDGQTVTFTAIPYDFAVTLWLPQGQSYNNVTFYPMIRLATDASSDYQPYSMTNQELTPITQAVSNRNLLDNPWFTVNQRGFTTGNTAGFTVDRWRLSWNPGNIDVSFSNGAITLDATGKTGKGYFVQFIDNLDIAGKVVTASVLLSDGTIKTGTGVMPIKGGNNVTVITDDFEAYYQYGASNDTPRFYISVGDGNSITIKAVKLELGSVSTLAMDTAPNYQQELAKCQRYFLRLPNTGSLYANIGFGVSFGDNALSITIPTPVTMRALPTVTSSGIFAVRGDGKFISATIGGSSEYSENSVTLNATTAVTVTPNVAFALLTDNDSTAYIDFSADL